MMNPLLRYPCQFCRVEVRSDLIRSPGKTRMGRVIMEAHVCQGCQDKMFQAIDTLFLGKRSAQVTKCNLCDSPFGSKGPFYAHRRPVTKQEWKTVPLCEKCFGKYHECCEGVAKGGS